jgi:hypothetical protein
MVDANDIVIEALLDDVLDESMLVEAMDEALRLVAGDDDPADRTAAIDRQIRAVDEERSRVVAAIATGGHLEGLVAALQAREAKRAALESQRQQLGAERRLRACDVDRVRNDLLTLADSWRRVLADDPTNARPIVSSLLVGRVTITPKMHASKRWILSGEGSHVGCLSAWCSRRGIVPTGIRRYVDDQTSAQIVLTQWRCPPARGLAPAACLGCRSREQPRGRLLKRGCCWTAGRRNFSAQSNANIFRFLSASVH